jgi:hypothetical protein
MSDPDKKGPSTNRIVLWIVVGGIGLYLVVSGLIGILGH